MNSILEFVKNDSRFLYYYPLLYVMAWTGIRIGEATGLCWQCVDFKNELIYIHRTLEHTKVDGKYQFIWKEPKTAAGYREIPMLKDVKKILLDLKGTRKTVSMRTEKEATFEDMVFLTPEAKTPIVNGYVNRVLYGLVATYNEQAKEENRLPHISCHIFRHSFTCWLIENFSMGENTTMLDTLKYIQHILGHEDASVTLNTYAEIRPEKLKEKHETLRKKAAGK